MKKTTKKSPIKRKPADRLAKDALEDSQGLNAFLQLLIDAVDSGALEAAGAKKKQDSIEARARTHILALMKLLKPADCPVSLTIFSKKEYQISFDGCTPTNYSA